METRLDLQPLWQCPCPDGSVAAALLHPWGAIHRPDWAERGLIIWPRGGQSRILRLDLACPAEWRAQLVGRAKARLALRWWAEDVTLRVDGEAVHRGDLFDTACRWPLPERWWQGQSLQLELELRSPLHDDGALIHSHLDLEPLDPGDPQGLLQPLVAQLHDLRRDQGHGAEAGPGAMHWLGHAHLDLAWLWPVADTWRAAERTFESVLALMERFEDLRFGHSTPALYAWLEQHRPRLFARIRLAMEAGRFEPLNGPWVETDAVLIATASLVRQFQAGQHYSQSRFPEWEHALAWLPDSFGFGAGLPAVARATGVRWFCTHKLAWNATTPFPHRLFRWRSRCGSEVLALMTAPIGTDADPLAMERYRLQWQGASGVADALWLPGVGDHGGGPSAEMLEQLALWRQQSAAAPQRPGTLRDYLAGLEPLASGLPVWRDELFLELHRGCATSRPDQKRHNRSLERLLREADLAQVLAGAMDAEAVPPGPGGSGAMDPAAVAPRPLPAGAQAWDSSSAGSPSEAPVDWRPLLFQQFHDILPGTAIPEVYDQAESQWRAARRLARRQRDRALLAALGSGRSPLPAGVTAGTADPDDGEDWAVVQLQPLSAAPRTLRLPPGCWSLAPDAPGASVAEAAAPAWVEAAEGGSAAVAGECAAGAKLGAAGASGPSNAAAEAAGAEVSGAGDSVAAAVSASSDPAILPSQEAPGGGVWVQLPPLGGVAPLKLQRWRPAPAGCGGEVQPIANPVRLEQDNTDGEGVFTAQSDATGDSRRDAPKDAVRVEATGARWRLDNGLIGATIGPEGVEQLWDGHGRELLAGPLEWRRWRDQGEFWDAWDIAADYRDHPLPWTWSGAPHWRERGPLCASFVWRGHCGPSPVRLEGRLLAGSPWLELVLQVHWQQRHELLRLEVPLAQPACRWAADTSGGVIERPAIARNPREESRWEVPAISWIASVAQAGGGDLAVLLDGPQGVSGQAERLGVSLLRGPTWPDPGADNGLQRQRLALMACPSGWRGGAVPAQAQRFREPLWCRPLGRRGAAIDVPIRHSADAPIGSPTDEPTGAPINAPIEAAPTGAPNQGPGVRRDAGDSRWPNLPPLAADLQLVSLRPAATPGEALLAVQNLGPCRRQLNLGPHWLVLARCDGLEHDPGEGAPGGHCDDDGDQRTGLMAIGPWQLAFWRVAINPRGRQRDR